MLRSHAPFRSPIRSAALLVVVSVLTTVPTSAVAQASRGTPDARLHGRLDDSTGAAVRIQLDSARLAGLPVEPLVDRALEGASKRALGRRVTGGDIVAAVRRLREALGSARLALGSRATSAELAAGASALQADVASSALVSLRQARTEGPLTVPLGVLTDLVTMGVPADSAARTVVALARTQDAALLAFQRDVERDVGVGILPSVAVSVRAAGLEEYATSGLHSASGAGLMNGGPVAKPPAPAPRKP